SHHGHQGWAPLQAPLCPARQRADFEGLSREFSCDVPDLHELDFGDCIASLKVLGQPWVAYTGAKYEGEAHVFEEGEHPAVGRPRSFSSLRLVHHDLCEPQITLYERPHFQGARKVVTEETNLAYGYFNDRVGSHEVQRGVWELSQHPGAPRRLPPTLREPARLLLCSWNCPGVQHPPCPGGEGRVLGRAGPS
uniref:Beta/gamma crystallin 'Greek key' domain-containing protein n=1 Tax=Nothoprocta perdicaria TaxID=30464 RepID=A0A8C6YZQ4_NOTPE